MEITIIGNNNKEYFEDMLPESYAGGKAAFGIIEDEKAVGCGIFSMINGAAELEYVFVEPEYRRKGLGKRFIAEIAGTVKESGTDLMISFIHGNEELRAFLESCGFICRPAIEEYSFGIAEMLKQKSVRRILKKSEKTEVSSFLSLSTMEIREIRDRLRKTGADSVLLEEGQYDRKLSFATFTKRRPVCVLLAKKVKADEVYLSVFVNYEEDYHYMLTVLSYFLRAALINTGENGKVVFLDGGTRALPLINYLLPAGKKAGSRGYGYYAQLNI
jgi:N-acetylglutamate synthase-like GNAT family acetyltransferase